MDSGYRSQTVLAVLLSLLVGICCYGRDASESTELAGEESSPAAPVATLNVMQVFQENAEFQKGLKELKQDVEKYDKFLQAKKARFEAQQKEIEADTSENQSEARAKLLQSRAEAATAMQLKRLEVINRESKLYAETYKKLQQAVSQVAEELGTEIVIRVQPPKAGSFKNEGSSFSVVYHEGMDLTERICRKLAGKDSPDDISRVEPEVDEKALRVAVVDLKKVMAQYAKHQERDGSVKQQSRELETEIADGKKRVAALEAQLKQAAGDTELVRDLTRSIALEKSAIELKTGFAKKDLEKSTNETINLTLVEIRRAVARYARSHSIRMIINYDSSVADQKDPKSVLSGVTKAVVYQADLDISEVIVQILNSEDSNVLPEAEKVAKRFAGSVALVDMAAVYKKDKGFRARMGELQQETADFQKYLQSRKIEVEALKAEIESVEKGSEVHQQLSKHFAREIADVKIESELKKQELTRKQAECYAKTYVQIQQNLAKIAKKRGVGLIIRFDRSPPELEERESIIKAVNRSIVFQNSLDLTEEVIRSANARANVQIR